MKLLKVLKFLIKLLMSFVQVRVRVVHVPIILFFLFSLATGSGSPQQRKPITVGPYYLSHHVHFPCGRKPEYPEKTHDFRLR